MDLCVVSGIVYDGNGLPAAGVNVYVVKVNQSGAVIQQEQLLVDTSDAVGAVSFTVPRSSTVWLSGSFYIGSTDFSASGGVAVDIPDAATATLESLGAAVTGPTTGLTVDGLSGLYSTLNIGSGLTVSSPSAGVALLDTASSTESVQDTVGAMVPAALLTYNDTPGTLTLTPLVANRIWAGPATGVDAVPTARLLVAADIPSLLASKISDFAAAVVLVAPALADGKIYVGNVSGVGIAVTPSGDVTMTNAGVFAIASLPAISGVNLTALNASNLGSGTVPLARLSGITNTEIAAAAAIAYSKLSLTGAILNADLAGSIALSKLSITGTPDGTKFLRDDGAWTTLPAAGATTALDNLAAVAINTSLLPASTQSLGSATFPWLSSFVGNTTQYESVSQSAGLITHAALGSATNIGIALTSKGTGAVNVTGLGTAAAPAFVLGAELNSGWYQRVGGFGIWDYSNAGTAIFELTSTGANLKSDKLFGFSSSTIGTSLDATISRNAAGIVQVGTTAANASGKLNCAEYQIAGTKVIGAQGAAVADATDAGSAITQLNLLLARARAHGWIAT